MIKPVVIGDVGIRLVGEEESAALLRDAASRIMLFAQRESYPDFTPDLAAQNARDHLRGIVGDYAAVTQVEAAEGEVDSVAREKVRNALCVAYYCKLFHYTDGDAFGLSIRGEACDASGGASLVALAVDGEGYYPGLVFPQVKWDIDFDEAFFERAQRFGCGFLAKQFPLQGCEFHKALFRAIKWYVRGRQYPDKEDKLLCYAIAFEVLLNPAGDGTVRAHVAEGTALLTCPGLADRISVSKRMKELYDERSSLVHGGVAENVSWQDIRFLESRFTMLMISLTTTYRNLRRLDNLREEVLKLKMAGGEEQEVQPTS